MIGSKSPHLVESRGLVLGSLSFALALQALPAEARPLPSELAEKNRAIQLEPSTPWQLDLLEDRCRLARQFDSSAGPGLVMIEQMAPSKGFDLTVAGPDIARSRMGSWFYIGMRSDLEMETFDPLEFDVAGYDIALALPDVRIDRAESSDDGGPQRIAVGIDRDAASKMERIVFRRSTAIVSFETGNMEAPFEALNDCTSELLLAWGLDTKTHGNYMPPQMPDEKSYFSRLHHEWVNAPDNRGGESLLRVRAMVDSDGSVSECIHEFAFSSAAAHPDVCSEIEEMRFDPAMNFEGEPIASFYSNAIFLSRYDPWTADAHGGRQ